MNERELLAMQPGRPPAVFDPARRALWDAEVKEQRAISREARLTEEAREARAALLAWRDAKRLRLRIYALQEGRLKRRDFSSVTEASRRLKVRPYAIVYAIRHGTRCCGREWWWTSRPLSERPMRIRRPKLIANGRSILADGIIFDSLDEFMKAMGIGHSLAYRCLRNGYFTKWVQAFTPGDGSIIIDGHKYASFEAAGNALHIRLREIRTGATKGTIGIRASISYTDTTAAAKECAA